MEDIASHTSMKVLIMLQLKKKIIIKSHNYTTS